MRRHKIATSLSIMVCIALAGYSSPANATVIIKTFQFSICVTGMKSPDACKNAGADAHVVVSDEKMENIRLEDWPSGLNHGGSRQGRLNVPEP